MIRNFVLALACTLCFVSPSLAESPQKLTFAWAVPGRVIVTEASTKGGQTAQVRYEVTLKRDPKGKNLHVRLQNFQILAIEGVNLSDPKVKADLNRANKLAAAIPTLVIDPRGKFVDVIEYEAMVDKVLASMPDIDDKTRSLLKSPETLAMMKQKSVDFWQAWVGAWVDAKLAANSTRTETQLFPMPDGSKVEGKVTFKHLGVAKNDDKLIALELESRIEGDAVTKAMKRYFARVPNAAPDGHNHGAEELTSVAKITGMRVVTDPKTLRPKLAETDSIMQVKMGKETQTQSERHSYSFEWK